MGFCYYKLEEKRERGQRDRQTDRMSITPFILSRREKSIIKT
jgi:hypothetical protein